MAENGMQEKGAVPKRNDLVYHMEGAEGKYLLVTNKEHAALYRIDPLVVDPAKIAEERDYGFRSLSNGSPALIRITLEGKLPTAREVGEIIPAGEYGALLPSGSAREALETGKPGIARADKVLNSKAYDHDDLGNMISKYMDGLKSKKSLASEGKATFGDERPSFEKLVSALYSNSH